MGIFDKKDKEAKDSFEIDHTPPVIPAPTPKPEGKPKAKGNKAEALREQARKLLEKAKAEDRAVATRIGELVLKHADENFASFNLTDFKSEVNEIRGV